MPKILFHGDSNTAEIYSIGPANWTSIVAAGLHATETINLAVSGRHAAQVKADLPVIIGHQPALCLIMIGTNDMVDALQPGVDVNHQTRLVEYLGTMSDILEALAAAAIPTVILSPIFTLKARETARFPDWVNCLRTICLVRDVPFVDVWSHMAALSAVQTDAVFSSYYLAPSAEAWHLSHAGHAMLASLVLSQVTLPPPSSTIEPITYLGHHQSVENLSTYTFPGVAFGAARAERAIVVAVGTRANASRGVPVVMIAGVGAVPVITKLEGVTDLLGLYRANVPEGTSGEIVVACTGEMLRCAIKVWGVIGGTMAHVQSATAGVGASPVTLALDVFGGVIAAAWFNSNLGVGSISGVTEDSPQQNPETPSNTLIAGHQWLGVNQAGRQIAVASSTNFNAPALLVAASFD